MEHRGAGDKDMGPGGAGRRYLGAGDAGWAVRGAEDGRGAAGAGPTLSSLLPQPSRPWPAAASGGGGNPRRGEAAAGRLRLGGSVPGRPPAHVAPPRSPARPRLCVGQQVPGLPRPCVRVSAPPAGCPGTPEGHCVRSLGGVRGGTPAAAPQPPGDSTLLGWDGPAAGPRSRSQSPRRPDRGGLLLLRRQVAPRPLQRSLGQRLLSPLSNSPRKRGSTQVKAAKTPPSRKSLEISFSPLKNHYDSHGGSSLEPTTCIRTIHLFGS